MSLMPDTIDSSAAAHLLLDHGHMKQAAFCMRRLSALTCVRNRYLINTLLLLDLAKLMDSWEYTHFRNAQWDWIPSTLQWDTINVECITVNDMGCLYACESWANASCCTSVPCSQYTMRRVQVEVKKRLIVKCWLHWSFVFLFYWH